MTNKSPYNVHRLTAKLGKEEIIIETGKFAEQAGGAVTVQLGDTLILATATMSSTVRPASISSHCQSITRNAFMQRDAFPAPSFVVKAVHLSRLSSPPA